MRTMSNYAPRPSHFRQLSPRSRSPAEPKSSFPACSARNFFELCADLVTAGEVGLAGQKGRLLFLSGDKSVVLTLQSVDYKSELLRSRLCAR